MTGLRIKILLVLVTTACTLLGCSPPEPFRIGFIGGISGRYADLGIGGLVLDGLGHRTQRWRSRCATPQGESTDGR